MGKWMQAKSHELAGPDSPADMLMGVCRVLMEISVIICCLTYGLNCASLPPFVYGLGCNPSAPSAHVRS